MQFLISHFQLYYFPLVLSDNLTASSDDNTASGYFPPAKPGFLLRNVISFPWLSLLTLCLSVSSLSLTFSTHTHTHTALLISHLTDGELICHDKNTVTVNSCG